MTNETGGVAGLSRVSQFVALFLRDSSASLIEHPDGCGSLISSAEEPKTQPRTGKSNQIAATRALQFVAAEGRKSQLSPKILEERQTPQKSFWRHNQQF